MSSSSSVNLAKAIGFHSLPAAIVFTALYMPLQGWFLVKSFTRPTYVHFALALFCATRIAAFALRSVLIADDAAGKNKSVLTADEVLSAVGFFSLLYSAYTVVLDIELLSGRGESNNPIIRLTRNRRLFKMTLLGAVGLGITAVTTSGNSPGNSSTGKGPALHQISTIMFVVLTVLQAVQTVVFGVAESETRSSKRVHQFFGSKYCVTILNIISILLLLREGFGLVTVNSIQNQNREELWYPLIVVPEFLVVLLFTAPGLVPDMKELAGRVPQRSRV